MNTEELNALKYRAYNTAVEHGFHEKEMTDAYYLGLVMSEMGEAINADRKGLHAGINGFRMDMKMGIPFKESFENHIKDSVEDEIADIVIRLLDFAGMKGFELNFEENIESSFTISQVLEREGLPSVLLQLNWALGEAFNDDELEACVSVFVSILSDCFESMTGSDKDLWWFVKQKMQYNDLRPMLNGKKY
jgi:NTP pyrophosphatase (non-canonical NTP hydrolase)